MSHRRLILDLLSGKRPDHAPAFSGLIHVTAEGLSGEGLSWREVHHEAGKMARAAASTFKLTGLPSVTLPLDLTAPAEALGAELVFYGEEEFQFPQVRRVLVESAKDIITENTKRTEIFKKGRLPVILEAIRLAREEAGEQAVISGMIPGPYTLLLYLCNPAKLFIEMKKEPQAVLDALFHLSSFISHLGRAYREAGANFITIHEMGGSPGFLGPARYEQFVHPALKELIANLPAPRVLSVCGDATKSLGLLNQAGAEAISLDQTVDMRAARTALSDTLLFGNLDPVATLWRADRTDVASAASRTREAGVDALWPGCDLVPSTPVENIRALIS
jgi:[methyl-Co(III) methanol-specific corrinoid protein]:coenzyme M methyltransferase